jgi:hypothetical protein
MRIPSYTGQFKPEPYKCHSFIAFYFPQIDLAL